jgi:hypothetical protein
VVRRLLISLLFTASVFAQRVTPERLLSNSVSVEGGRSDPAAVWTGQSFAVFWSDDAGVFAAAVGVDGQFRGPALRLTENELVGGVAFDGQELLLLTTASPGRVVARRLTKSFAPIGDPAVLAEGGACRVKWNGIEFIAWWVTNTNPGAIVVAKIHDGAVTASRVITSTPRPSPGRVSLAATPTDLLLVWEDHYGCEPVVFFPCISNTRLRATRLDSQLDILDPAGFEFSPEGYSPSIATNGRDFLVAWTDGLAMRAQRVHVSGAVLGEGVRVDPVVSGTSTAASAAWDDNHFLVVARDLAYPNSGIFGMVLDASGGLLSAPAIPIHVQSTFFEGPVTFPGPQSRFLVFYRRYDDQLVFRTYMRVVEFGPPAPPRRRSASH